MRLTYTDAAFTYHGVPMPGVPGLLNDDMAIAEGPQRWLFYIALHRGRTRSPATWRSYGEALYDWLQTCQANGWGWDEIEEGQPAGVPEPDAVPPQFRHWASALAANDQRPSQTPSHVPQLGVPPRADRAVAIRVRNGSRRHQPRR